MGEHKIILASVSPGAEGKVATALGQVFGIAQAATEPFVKSVPIVLLGDLDAKQAQTVANVLSDAQAAGCNIVISSTKGENMSQVNWPAPPKVAGHDMAAYKDGAIPVKAVAAAPVAGTPPQRTPKPAATIACPHCGKSIGLQVAPVDGGIRQVPVSQALQAAAAADDNRGKALPEVPNVQGSVEPSPQSPRSHPLGPIDLEEFERGVGGGGPPQRPSDALFKQIDQAIEKEQSGAAQRPKSPSNRPQGRTSQQAAPRSPGRQASGHGPSVADRMRNRKRRR